MNGAAKSCDARIIHLAGEACSLCFSVIFDHGFAPLGGVGGGNKLVVGRKLRYQSDQNGAWCRINGDGL